MSTKRKTTDSPLTFTFNLKKLKREEEEVIPCYFPMDVDALFKELGKYLEGDHLKNFKLTCKTFNNRMKEKSCAIEITPENIGRTSKTPGHHIIKLDGEKHSEVKLFLASLGNQSCPEVKHLTIDHSGIKGPYINYQCILWAFKNLLSFKIIRCRTNVVIKLNGQAKYLSSLEIHTTSFIKLILHQKIDNILLHTTERFRDDDVNMVLATVEILILNEDSTSDVNGVKCCADATLLKYGVPSEYGRTKYRTMDYPFKSFVPNPNFL